MHCANKFIIYGHRGAPAYYPENTLSSFELALVQGANGLETDIQVSRDGRLVLFHDNDMKRVTGVSGRISDYSWQELQEMFVYSRDGKLKDKILDLGSFCDKFAHLKIVFALELKSLEIEEELLKFVEEYDLESKTFITSFEYDILQNIRRYNQKLQLGYLTKQWDKVLIEKMQYINAGQICLQAETLNTETVQKIHGLGYSIRAWGVYNEELVRHVIKCGVDAGMTVDFPDIALDIQKNINKIII